VSRQRKDKAIKDALALVQSNDLVVYEALKVRDLVKNRKLAKSISDASWYQFTEWLNYLALSDQNMKDAMQSLLSK
jgi:putative transposase